MYEVSASRRTLLKGIAGALTALSARQVLAATGATALVDSPYGPVAPKADITTGLSLLQLPAGFAYKSFGWRGDPMADGSLCPAGHAGMGVILSRKAGRATELVLVRNHDVGSTAADKVINAAAVYDSGATSPGAAGKAGGGTSNLVFRDGNWFSMHPSLGGTAGNRAGGTTPWGTWLSCEGVSAAAAGLAGKAHGYVFEVSADPARTSGQPLAGMGRFSHAAAAVDPLTGIVYLTEASVGKSGLYRYLPAVTPGYPGSLALGGALQMARAKGVHNANLASAVAGKPGYELEWVAIADPDRDRGDATGPSGVAIRNAAGPFLQGWSQGALRMQRGDGIWHAQGKMYVVDGGGGAIWELDLATQAMRCRYSSPRDGKLIPDPAASNSGRLTGLNGAGAPYLFAENNIVLTPTQLSIVGKQAALAADHRAHAFAGACFDPSGRYLFVNIPTPGITFAITGPWAAGPL